MSESEHVKGLLYVDPSKLDTMPADNTASAFEHDPDRPHCKLKQSTRCYLSEK